MMRLMRPLESLSIVLMLTACASPAKPPTLTVQTFAAACSTQVDTLIVLLPGAYGHASDFVAEGFVDAIRSRGIAADVSLADATLPYYRDRDIVGRLQDDVVAPALARSVRHIWLAGVSIGGLGSLAFTNQQRGEVDGLLLVAPYLGERTIAAEVAASGGLAHWAPPGVIPADDDERSLWQWLKALTIERDDQRLPAVYLGFGNDDRYVAAHRLLAETLPGDHVFPVPGGHDWPAWREAWAKLLDAAPLPRGCPKDAKRSNAKAVR
jgi:pimeloyl-ACP methyl ester carboxylesterase